MKFTADLTDGYLRTWRECPQLAHARPRDVLEVGTYEGRSACWTIAERMRPGGRIVCVDTFDAWGADDRLERVARANIAEAAGAAGVRPIVHRGTLAEAMAAAPGDFAAGFDLIYIDGPKERDACLDASRRAWDLLRPGGALIWDDVIWDESTRRHCPGTLGPVGLAVLDLLSEVAPWMAEPLPGWGWTATQLVVQKPRPGRRCLLTIAAGRASVDEHAITSANHAAYAARCGAERVAIERPDLDLPYGPAAKFWAAEIAAAFDQTLFLDGDCVVRRDAPDIFDEVPLGSWGVVDEWPPLRSALAAAGDPDRWQREADALADAIGRPRVALPFAVNSGVMVLPRDATLYRPPASVVPGSWCVEQIALSFLLAEAEAAGRADVRILDPRWNWGAVYPAFESGLNDAWIVHYNAARRTRADRLRQLAAEWS